MEITQETTPLFTSRDALLTWIDAALDGMTVNHLELICAPNHPGRVQCFIDLDDTGVHEARSRLGGQIFGYETLVLSLQVAPDFGCPRLHSATQGPNAQCVCAPRRG